MPFGLRNAAQTFQRFINEEYGLLTNPALCVLGIDDIEFLGNRMTREGIRPSEKKVQALCEFPRPTSIRKLREFIGLLNFHRRFLANIARIIIPLTDLLKTTKAPSS
ncbi:uncharacterized protein LOC119449239 [Dermacentor silvarum]|uniref:uncharacterized protein LOC119440504 n=1 Tax=Dermacentor silvarum TaxID=543639 RepID=UPI001898F6DF|nr:uncharacterized protein LOC119440504 [Dermacentor silvarum]XP_037568344.1 uncharacterized protein LOC119449239 [Dermacentor silvarum]